jgi:hypothetical protein
VVVIGYETTLLKWLAHLSTISMTGLSSLLAVLGALASAWRAT